MSARLLRVYGDESADETQERVFAVAGIIGPESLWEQLEDKWTARNGRIPFHAKDCDSDQGEYNDPSLSADDNHRKNKALYRDLCVLLAESGLHGLGVAMDLGACRRVLPGTDIFPYQWGFSHIVDWGRTVATENDATVEFTFDSRKETEFNAGVLYDLIRETRQSFQDSLAPRVSFALSKWSPRVQAADLFAREVMKVLDNRVGPKQRPPRKSWVALKNSGRFNTIPLGEDRFSDLKDAIDRVSARHNYDADHGGWLSENRLVNNQTNMFRYLHLIKRVEGRWLDPSRGS